MRWRTWLGKDQQAIVSKAIEYNVPVIFIDPKSTLRTCPRCGSKLEYIHRLAHCPRCGFTADRDVVGTMNIHSRALKARVGTPGPPQTLL
ncbi:zinc ribbon domain-containing protein [Vulcanisaeta sp. JCM 16159]|uniref:zinc ribbon domain-containing protein n=1 Tax=Vulcanisaeta sp. JCM 16159 TaxID=1295371 RepID=UPI0006CFCC6A|nr:zinc ribbon domain-containing protein [Vulcanisaeta sp. JCM 16159]